MFNWLRFGTKRQDKKSAQTRGVPDLMPESSDSLLAFDNPGMLTDVERERLGLELQLPEPVLNECLELLKQGQMTAYEQDRTLRDTAQRYGTLREILDGLGAEDEAVQRSLDKARSALADNSLAQVESWLNRASEQAASMAREHADGASRLVTAAEVKAANGAIKVEKRRCDAAARYFAEAAALVPADDVSTLAGYLEQQGAALIDDCRPEEAQDPLFRAVALYDQWLEAADRKVASTSAPATWQTDEEIRYAEVEQLYRQAKATRERALGLACAQYFAGWRF